MTFWTVFEMLKVEKSSVRVNKTSPMICHVLLELWYILRSAEVRAINLQVMRFAEGILNQ